MSKLRLDHTELRQLWAAGTPLREIAARLGCSVACAGNRARRLGLPRRQRNSGDLPQNDMVRAYQTGQTARQIAQKVRCSQDTVLRLFRARGVEMRGRNGRNGYWLRLAPECAKLRHRGLKYAEIGARLGLTRSQVMHRLARMGMVRSRKSRDGSEQPRSNPNKLEANP